MPPSRKPGPEGATAAPPLDPGTLNLQQSPRPGPVSGPTQSSAQQITAEDAPMSGSAPVALGAGARLRIPVPGSNGLAIELTPRGRIPKGGSTSTLFIQDLKGKRQLRLDYGFNKTTNAYDWHWNQQGTNAQFGITDHTLAGPAGEALGQFARYYKYAGRVFLVAGAAVDLYSIVTASRPIRRSVQVVSAWAAASGGCRLVGAGGAAIGSAEPGLGTAIGGFVGCAIGAFIGYRAAESTSGYLYDWAENTVFTTLKPEPASPGVTP